MNEEPNSQNITSDGYLYDLMLSYADIYFQDMAVNTKQIARVIDVEVPLSIELEGWTIKYKKNLKACGECHLKRKFILINPEQANSEVKLTVLHEMIHAFNYMLFDKYKEFFLIYFYNKLIKKIGKKKLHRIINLYLDWDLRVKDHSLLFLLKSLELDLRLKKPLGTVMAYGRCDIFHYYQNKKLEWIPKRNEHSTRSDSKEV